jgi:hypothetical protein
MQIDDVVTPLDAAYFCVHGAYQSADAAEAVNRLLKGEDRGDYDNRLRKLTLPARTVGLQYPIVCGWGMAEGVSREVALWFGMGVFLHDAGMPTRALHDVFASRYNEHNKLWYHISYSICWDHPRYRNPFLQPRDDKRDQAPWQAEPMDDSLWHEWCRPGDPWHALWLLLNSAHQPELAWRAYDRLVADEQVKQRAIADHLLPPIIAGLCAGLINEEEVAWFRHGQFDNGGRDVEWLNYYQAVNEFNTVRFAAEYTATALALPDRDHAEVSSLLGFPGKMPTTLSLEIALERLQADWPRS